MLNCTDRSEPYQRLGIELGSIGENVFAMVGDILAWNAVHASLQQSPSVPQMGVTDSITSFCVALQPPAAHLGTEC